MSEVKEQVTKGITEEQINQVMTLVFDLNITAKSFEGLRQFFDKLPIVKIDKKKE